MWHFLFVFNDIDRKAYSLIFIFSLSCKIESQNTEIDGNFILFLFYDNSNYYSYSSSISNIIVWINGQVNEQLTHSQITCYSNCFTW